MINGNFICRKILWLAIVWFACPYFVAAKKFYQPIIVDPVLEPWQWTEFHELDTIEPSCLCKGRDGKLWLGAGNKAILYDGYQLHSFLVDSASLLSMAHERGENVLVTTAKGLYRFSEGEFRKILSAKFLSQQRFVVDKNDYVWIGSRYGLLKITPWNIRCFNPDGIFELATDGTIIKKIAIYTDRGNIVKSISEINFPVFRIHIDEKDIFWLACQFDNYEIAEVHDLQNIFSKSEWKFHNVDKLSGASISGLCRKSDDLLVVSASTTIGLQKLNLKTENVKSINLSRIGGDDLHTGIVKTSDGKIWIGGHSKIYMLDDKGWKLYQYPEVKLPLSSINIFLDRDDYIYFIGTSMFRKLEYRNGSYCTYQGLNFQCNTPDKRNWFSTNKGGVVEADSSLNYFSLYDTTDGLMDMVMQVYYSKKGQLWAAGSDDGRAAVALFDGSRWHTKRFSDVKYGVAYDGIKELSDSSIVFSINAVLSEFDLKPISMLEYCYADKTWRTYSYPQVPVRIASVSQTSDGRLWFSGGAVFVFDGIRTHTLDSVFTGSRWTDDIAISPDDKIWVAQGGYGVLFFNGTDWLQFGVKDGLASNMVTSLYYDGDQLVYMATDDGISCFDGKQIVPYVMHPGIGIPREKGTIRLSDNKDIWVNQGSREWYLYDLKNTTSIPEELSKAIHYKPDEHAPETYITFAEKEIPPEGNVLIRFTGKDFMQKTASSNLIYSYRVNKEEWSPYSSEKSVLLLDLEDGKYTFEVRSRDMDLNADLSPATVTFIVEPPVYKRAWFMFTIFFFLGTIIFLLTRLYRRNREIHELDQFKLRLFTDISHELKTPLTLIMLPLQKLREKENKNDEISKYINLIYENVERLSKLVHQVIDFRRLESKKVQLEYAPGDLISHLQSIYQYYKPLSDEKNFNFVITVENDELWLNYDADKLEKIIVNLLSNAFKYTPAKGLVELVEEWDEEKEQLVIKVSDNGPGIPHEMQKNIFERFYRLKNNLSGKVPGSGIGLSLVKELVELYKGDISVFSDGINGTEFKLVFPLKKIEMGVSRMNRSLRDNVLEEQVEKPLLLLIEDEPQMLEFVGNELAVSFEVMKADTAEKGLELMQQMPDLVISDVMLPGMDGVEFCRRIKESEETSHIPVILLTARDSEENIVQGIGMGADDYITKPFNMSELKARCLGLIENRKRLKNRFDEDKKLKAEEFTKNKGDQSFLKKAIDTVYQNLDNPEFDVGVFCSCMNMSKTLLYSKLKTLTGQSAGEFVRNIRLKEARQILLQADTELSVADVSYKVGFNDPLYFSRCFKKYFGTPPSEILKK